MKNAGYEFSSSQCKDKMKYMKRCYFKKMDNLGPKSTGSAPIKSKADETIEIEEDVENIDVKEEKTSEKGRKRKSTSDDLLDKLNSREEAKERRHLEKQAVQRESITVFQNVMNELLKKL
ncbi:uncharacterized protein LOC113004861 isoform X3 [Solenopsis invicta]|uniref:uncharacterized protein LOC113004861 isoform X3 n=1 Tax=Solenopsis invicta TaxID=13686 RepID=UPI00193DC95F|nr:uncharacterized protein LOC113004861 isoform X3 [Solenopsis invicta]